MELEKEIIDKIGANKTREYSFDSLIDLVDKDGEKSRGYNFYTYRSQVCILDDQGMDVDFSNYELRSQKRIHREIMAGNYKK